MVFFALRRRRAVDDTQPAMGKTGSLALGSWKAYSSYRSFTIRGGAVCGRANAPRNVRRNCAVLLRVRRDQTRLWLHTGVASDSTGCVFNELKNEPTNPSHSIRAGSGHIFRHTCFAHGVQDQARFQPGKLGSRIDGLRHNPRHNFEAVNPGWAERQSCPTQSIERSKSGYYPGRWRKRRYRISTHRRSRLLLGQQGYAVSRASSARRHLQDHYPNSKDALEDL
jgi:hypothetical protein